MGKSGKEDLFRKFKDSFDNMEGHFHVLDHRVPVEVQLAYFRYSEKLRKEKPLDYPVSDETCEELYQTLLTTDGGNSVRRRLLALLAISRSVRAYRLLEEYTKEPDPAIANWAYMAAMEARLTLESELSDEKQIFISTGLGGRDDKLRYYVLLVCREPQGFLDYQRQVVDREFAYYLERQDCEIDEARFSDHYVELLLLMPMRVDIQALMNRVIGECNQYGNFLSRTYTVTNVKELTKEEINEFVAKELEKEENEDTGTSD